MLDTKSLAVEIALVNLRAAIMKDCAKANGSTKDRHTPPRYLRWLNPYHGTNGDKRLESLCTPRYDDENQPR